MAVNTYTSRLLWDALTSIVQANRTPKPADLGPATARLRDALLAVGSETPDNLDCVNRIVFGAVADSDEPVTWLGPMIADKPILLSDILWALEAGPVPESVRERIPGLEDEDWDAAIRIIMLIMSALERPVKDTATDTPNPFFPVSEPVDEDDDGYDDEDDGRDDRRSARVRDDEFAYEEAAYDNDRDDEDEYRDDFDEDDDAEEDDYDDYREHEDYRGAPPERYGDRPDRPDRHEPERRKTGRRDAASYGAAYASYLSGESGSRWQEDERGDRGPVDYDEEYRMQQERRAEFGKPIRQPPEHRLEDVYPERAARSRSHEDEAGSRRRDDKAERKRRRKPPVRLSDITPDKIDEMWNDGDRPAVRRDRTDDPASSGKERKSRRWSNRRHADDNEDDPRDRASSRRQREPERSEPRRPANGPDRDIEPPVFEDEPEPPRKPEKSQARQPEKREPRPRRINDIWDAKEVDLGEAAERYKNYYDDKNRR